MSKIDVIIPVYKPDDKLKKLLEGLKNQTVKPDRLILLWTIPDGIAMEDIDTDEYVSYYESDEDITDVEIHFIKQSEFDHGGTRAFGMSLSEADFVMCMTQDAVPYNDVLVEKLLEKFNIEGVAAVYARQLPREDATLTERITREFNYPDSDRIQNNESFKKYGIKTYFCSDVCAMYKKMCYDEAGGFVKRTIFNEDMIMAAGLVKLGYTVIYNHEAQVVHSHHYSYREQYRRNFDLAVSQKEHPEVFEGVPSEGEGIKMVFTITGKLVKAGKLYLIPDLFIESAFKYLGYRKGKSFQKLSDRQIMKVTMNKSYWLGKERTN